MTGSRSAKNGAEPRLRTLVVAFLVLSVAASATLAGPDTPCAQFIPGHLLCQLPRGLIAMMGLQCIGQIALLNSVPVFIALVAMSASRWKSGAHLLVIGTLGAAGGVSLALFTAWPSVRDLGTHSPVHLLGAPLLTTVLVLAILSLEQLTRCSCAGLRPAQLTARASVQ